METIIIGIVVPILLVLVGIMLIRPKIEFLKTGWTETPKSVYVSVDYSKHPSTDTFEEE